MGLTNRWLALLLLATSLPAQRSPFFATVTGPDGKPLANASVTCVSSRDAIHPWPTDTVVAQTDERGQARCLLLTGRIYVAWGVAAQAKDGKHRVTSIARLISAGRVVTLPAVESQPARSIELQGLAAWRDAGAQSVRWYPDRTVDHGMDLGMPEKNTVTVPATPWGHGVLAVCDGRGTMVCMHVRAGSEEPLILRKPQQCKVHVTDDQGQPLANTELSCQIPELGGSRLFLGAHSTSLPHMRDLGSTDASGQLSFMTPELLTHTESWGTYNDTVLVFASRKGMQQAAAAAENLEPLTLRMQPAEPLEVRITGRDADAADLVGMGTYSANPTPASSMSGPRAATTVKRGSSWLVHGVSPTLRPRIRLPGKRPAAVLSKATSAPESPLLIDLDKYRKTTVAVTHETTGPAACVLLVGRPKQQIPMRWEAILATDSSGHADLLADGHDYFVYAVSGTSHGLAMIDRDTPHVDIVMTTLDTMTVRCVDGKGFAIAGARSRGESTTLTGNQDGADLQSQWLRLSTMMIWHFLEPCRSGLDGRMQLPVFLAGNVEAEARVWIAGAESKPFQLIAGTEQEVVIE